MEYKEAIEKLLADIKLQLDSTLVVIEDADLDLGRIAYLQLEPIISRIEDIKTLISKNKKNIVEE